MSLTNPKNVVTEERLSEFYGQILPYLGGMPEALANKFSKSDLYSTDEKIVGCWTDGRPIYQKTIVSTTSSTSPSDKYINIGASIDTVVDLNGLLESAGYFVKLPWYTFSGGTLILNFITALNNSASSNKNAVRIYVENPNYVNKTVWITIRYTKTTDAANSFKYGNETDYSTDEKIIGTWIDGKPIYQKTVNIGALPNSTIKTVAHGISNIGTMVSLLGTAQTTAKTMIPLPYSHGTGPIRISADITNIMVEATTDRTSYTGYATIQYTKTTD